jgi:hypothetical protein
VAEMRLYDLRVTVEQIEGRSVCGLQVGDYFEVTESNRVRIPAHARAGEVECVVQPGGRRGIGVRSERRESRLPQAVSCAREDSNLRPAD